MKEIEVVYYQFCRQSNKTYKYMEKIPTSVWKTDPGRKKFLNNSKQELKNSAKRFKEKKESVQVRVEKNIYKMLKHFAKLNEETIVQTISRLLDSVYRKYIELSRETSDKNYMKNIKQMNGSQLLFKNNDKI